MSETDTSRAAAVEALIARIPLAQTLGMACEIRGDEMTAILPFQKKLIGNFTIQALHGGAIASFLELTAVAKVFLATELAHPPKPINVTIDYLRQGRAEDLYARAYVNKLGRRMASVRAEAWQGERAKPVAALHAHFLVGGLNE
ncbi:MAG: PaaI family thioesterase [Pseudomonadota bacterium]